MRNKNTLNDRWFYLPILILSVHFIYRLADGAKLILYFPLDYFNDVGSYMAQLHFLKVCGFLSYCDYWYNGIITFQATPPGWFFFALPFYNLFGDVKVATYFTLVLTFVLAFSVIYIAGKYFNISKVKRTAFFSFMFMTSLSVGSFIKLGRVHELFSWFWFLIFAFLVIYYKDRGLGRSSLLIIPAFSLILLSYQSAAILASLLFLGLFLVKKRGEKVYVVAYFLGSLLLASFWLVPFVQAYFSGNSLAEVSQNEWLWQFTREHLVTNVAVFVLPILLFGLFYLYWKTSKRPRNELYFFSPVLILGLLYFLRLTPFIPVFNKIFPDPYLTFFLFFVLFFFFSSDYSYLKNSIFKLIPWILFAAAIISILINVFHTPTFIVPDSKEHSDLIYMLGQFEGSFLLFGDYPTTIYSKAVYAYAPIYYNLKTPFGWYFHLKEWSYFERFTTFDNYLGMDCGVLSDELNYFNTTHVVGYGSACEKFSDCNFEFSNNSGEFCLYSPN